VGSASGPFFVRALFLELKTTVGIRRDEPGGICTRQVALADLVGRYAGRNGSALPRRWATAVG